MFTLGWILIGFYVLSTARIYGFLVSDLVFGKLEVFGYIFHKSNQQN